MRLDLLVIGRPDWFIIAMVTGSISASLLGIGILGGAYLPDPLKDQVRSWCQSVSPVAMIVVPVLLNTVISPAMFMPDAMASEVDIAVLNNSIESYYGKKLRVTGEIAWVEQAGYETYEIRLHDRVNNSWLIIFDEDAFEKRYPKTGQWVECVISIERNRNDGTVEAVLNTLALVDSQ